MTKKSSKQSKDGNVSMDGIGLEAVLSSLLSIPDLDATKPIKEKKKRVEQKGCKAKKAKTPSPG